MFPQFADVLYVYGLSDGNTLEARRLYEQGFPNRHNPNSPTFPNFRIRLCQKRSFEQGNNFKRAQRSVRTSEIDFGNKKNNLNYPHVLIWKILHYFLLYFDLPQRVHALLPDDSPMRMNFCQLFFQKVYEKPLFHIGISFTDEAIFSEYVMQDFHNNHFRLKKTDHE